jgi:hypothetical protein
MKSLLLPVILCVLSCKESSLSENKNLPLDKLVDNKIEIMPVFSEGFGIASRLKAEIVRDEESNKLFIVNPQNDSHLVSLDAFTNEVYTELEKILTNKKSAKLLLIGYESIISNGIPSEGISIKEDTDLELPSGPSWHVESEYVVLKIVDSLSN